MSWNEELLKDITTLEQLKEVMAIAPEEEENYKAVIARFPVRVTPYYLSLIDKNDPEDPIARMCLPSLDELNAEGSFDTSNEAGNTKFQGLQHKYTRTTLILSSNRCAMYCRHCFRKRLVGFSEDELNRRVDAVTEYVKEHKEINNVLISGGDPLMNPNHIIERYLSELSKIDHLDFIRIGTRVPVTFPQRISEDEELLEIFKKYSEQKQLYVTTQYNHPRELTKESLTVIKKFQEMKVEVKNQTVLLKGINDNPEVLGQLLAGLTKNGIDPYYIFQCRPVTGVKGRFQVPILEGIEIVDKAKSMQNGLGKSVRYVMSHVSGKIEIIGTLENKETVFKFHQSHEAEHAAKIFTVKLEKEEAWLDDDITKYLKK